METILLVEDEESLQYFLRQELTFENYHVISAYDGQTALDLYATHRQEISAIILDWMLPQKDGIEVLKTVRTIDPVLPILLMTARNDITDKVTGLDDGADDYITKPFKIEELLARLRTAIRRLDKMQGSRPEHLELSFADVTLNVETRRVTRAGMRINLTQREFDLLATFLQHPERVLSRDELFDLVWGVDFAGQYNTVDVYIRHLRQKLALADKPELIWTERGVGYVLRQN
ncbi:response regulator transcription factor [Weissella muntiaci]|uniref:Response regulator transcription factor n=1 Tax=Weissella muntiaci TaxID=2508881 RepID=A0A6C2CA23_9LACO|nr:response regulator transcription factor [Weissella muntiaci]TYC50807.1 response regulator transcription factor [Weissella muntiaci]